MFNVKTILFPTDFSGAAKAASTHALYLARRFEAALHVLHVAAPSERVSEMLEGYDHLAGEVGAEAGVPITQAQVQYHSASAGILEYVQAQGVDLIAMGTHGRAGIGRLVIGSVAEEVVRRAPCPVYTVRRRAEEHSGTEDARLVDVGTGRVERILVPVDFSASSRRALLHAQELAAAYEARVDLLYITSQPDLKTGHISEVKPTGLSRRMREHRRLEALAEEVGLGAEVHVEYSYPVGGILEFARREGTDLIVMATHGRTGLKHVLMGSVAERTIRLAPCPVFVVKSFGKSLLSVECENSATLHEVSTQS